MIIIMNHFDEITLNLNHHHHHHEKVLHSNILSPRSILRSLASRLSPFYIFSQDALPVQPNLVAMVVTSNEDNYLGENYGDGDDDDDRAILRMDADDDDDDGDDDEEEEEDRQ